MISLNDSHNSSIHQMKESDLEQVLQIAEDNNLSFWSLEDYRSEIVRADSLCCVVENQQREITAFLVARLIMQMNYAELYNIAVKDSYKRRGIAKTLLIYLTNYCTEKYLDQINLEVRESNTAAITFYQNTGFQKVTIIKDFYRMPTENAITMTKHLYPE